MTITAHDAEGERKVQDQFDAVEGIRKIREIVGRWLTPGSEVKARDAMHQVVGVLLDTRLDVVEIRLEDPEPEMLERLEQAMLCAADEPRQLVAYSNEPVEHSWSSQAAIDVGAERRRQIEAEGRDFSHDDQYTNGELAAAASCYALHAHDGPEPRLNFAPSGWPWTTQWWKPSDTRRDLVKAGALILAEIERLDRAAAAQPADLTLTEAAMLQAGIDRAPAEKAWIPHKAARPCPFDHPDLAMVDIRFRDGSEKVGVRACNYTWFWRSHDQQEDDIVAFRLTPPDSSEIQP